jgi:hypothetical protein
MTGGRCDACTGKSGSFQRKAVNARNIGDVPSIVDNVLRSPSHPLDAATRAIMEPRFGYDFSRVRVHSDAAAAASARQVNALAYTVGSDIVFANAQYAPTAVAGKRLLAHELTHVVQQRAAGPLGSQRQAGDEEKRRTPAEQLPQTGPAPGARISAPDPARMAADAPVGNDRLEQEANAMADLVVGSPNPLPDAGNSVLPARRVGQDLTQVPVHAHGSAKGSARGSGARTPVAGADIAAAAEKVSAKPAGKRAHAHQMAPVLSRGTGDPQLQRFEAPVHESVELFSLTTDAAGKAAGFSLEEASATYFGNWMRDMNQVFVPLVVDLLEPDVIFAAINNLALKKFGRSVTPEQFGYYIPTEHMDSPAGLVAKHDLLPKPPTIHGGSHSPALPAGLDTPQQTVDPKTATVLGAGLFSVDQTGVMAHIRDSSQHVERRLELAVQSGRTPDGLMHFGAALHAVEDLFAHSNWIEIAVSKVLAENPPAKMLPNLKGADRQAFTYTANSGDRPILTTGSFTGKDTQISVGSELVKVLRTPLAAPKSEAESAADAKFTLEVLRALNGRLRSNPAFHAAIRQAIDDWLPDAPWGLDNPVIDNAMKLPLDQIYFLTVYLPAIYLPSIPQSVKDATGLTFLQTSIRDLISNQVLKPAADRIEAAVPEAQVAQTSLIDNLADNQRVAAGNWTASELRVMQEKARSGGASVEEQKKKGKAESSDRVTTLTQTPEKVLAGPSHSQLAKDHPSSPFFGLAFRMATIADRKLRDRLFAAWAEIKKGPTTPYAFPGKPAEKDAATLYDARQAELTKTLSTGQSISQKGAKFETESYDLAAAPLTGSAGRHGHCN